ncbi:hypothetical protein K432DRAFT_53460 [Lepidopterella palustris CBS 459.81]|uniref:Uncharacterized protein n=1 Tax=Lepidopterella palustris CBS 459.81 TaxID=1314670 RepID=A0A8E2EAN5_9PEZI|nr:hypothetical protein K432DRAFT_53460 [Lepidopterella palustris CBS 459.81]
MSSSKIINSTCILDTSADWKTWFFVVKKMAEAAMIWHLVDPSIDPAPSYPSAPIYPKPRDVKAEAIHFTELDADEQRIYLNLQASYKAELARYKETQVPLSQIQDFIFSTVTRRNFVFIQGCSTPYHMLRELQKRFAPTNRARELELLELYRALQKPPTAKNIENWLWNWERVYSEAAAFGLPEVTKCRPQRDFLQAIASIDPDFAGNRSLHLEDAILFKEPYDSLFDLIEQFRNCMRLRQATLSKVASN